MGVLLIVGIGVLVLTIVSRMSHRSAQTAQTKSEQAKSAEAVPAQNFGSASVTLPHGAKVIEMAGAGSRLVLRVAKPDGGEQLLVLDPATGVLLGTIELRPAD